MMNVKYILAAIAAAAAITACEKEPASDSNRISRDEFEAWGWHRQNVEHKPVLDTTELGSYLLAWKKEGGDAIGSPESAPFVRVSYIATDLKGNITGYSEESAALQMGIHHPSHYYGPRIWNRGNIPAGIEECLAFSNVGDSVSVAIPGWLMTTNRRASADEYYRNESGNAGIYTFRAVERITDIVRWELDSLDRYISKTYGQTKVGDSLKLGFYFIRTGEPTEDISFEKDTVIYVNYTARRLDGQVFDTSVADTAKHYFGKDFRESTTYAPVQINCKQNYSDITMTSGNTSVIDGFAYGLSHMHPFEKASFIFYSALGYAENGSGNAVPAYCPLRFDVEVVKKP